MLKGLLSGIKALVRGGQDEDWDLSDRRELVRLQCHYDVEFVHRGKKHEGRIVDMGLKGMKLRGFRTMKKGEEVAVNYGLAIDALHETVNCKVLWCRQREKDYVTFVGLEYNEPDDRMRKSWVKCLLQELGFGKSKIYEKRKHVRADCFVPGRVVYGHAAAAKGQLQNLGVGGALVEIPQRLEVGADVELSIGPYEEIKQFSLNAKVVHCAKVLGKHQVSLQFQSISDQSFEKLSECLLYLLRNSWCD